MARKPKKIEAVPEGIFDIDKACAWYKEAFEPRRGPSKPTTSPVKVPTTKTPNKNRFL